MQFHFDLIARPRRVRWLRFAVLFLALAICVYVGLAARSTRTVLLTKRGELQAETQRLNAPVATSTMKPAELAKEWQLAVNVAEQLERPWKKLFRAMGRAAKHGNIAFLSIEPEPEKGRLVLVAEARDLGTMLDFLNALQDCPEFSEVALQSHTISTATPEKPVRFRTTATWRANL